MGLITRQPNRQFQDNMVSQLDDNMDRQKQFMLRNYLKPISGLMLLLLLTGCAAPAQGDIAKITQEKTELQMAVSQLTSEKTDLETKVQSFLLEKSDSEKQILEKTDEIKALSASQQKVQTELDEANLKIKAFADLEAKYGALTQSEIDAQIAATNRKTEEDKIATEKLLAKEAADREEAAAQAAKLAEEEAVKAEAAAKKGYETGITFNQLARTPDDYTGDLVKFKGKVLQVIEGDSEINLRIAVNDDYDKVVLVYYPKTLLSKRVLEDDQITLYGTSRGLYTYESTMGGEITIPLIEIDKLDIR